MDRTREIDCTNPQEVTQLSVEKLGEIVTRDDKKSIPTYKGYDDNKPVEEWILEAEAIAVDVAENNGWGPEQKLKLFASRLKGYALDWHRTQAAQIIHWMSLGR